ncbi:MAG TPA: hypothetical protein VJP02_11805 [Candidatus Sulfotelmatobacter sp.]|nr:hypothetical protein [Candidatus Sulfotelmatobacter sp.]
MDVRRPISIASAVLIIAIASPFALAQAGSSNSEPASHLILQRQQSGFLDFTLKRINPRDTDYGACFDEGRAALAEETVMKTYFWSNVVALGMLGCLFTIVVCQHRVHRRREWMSAEILAQLEQSLARSDARVRQITERNLALAGSISALKHASEQAPPSPTRPADSTPHANRTPPLNGQAAAPTSSKTKATKPMPDRQSSTATVSSSSVATMPASGSQISLFKPEVELVTKVNALEQQLSHSQEMEKQLRRQLTDAGRKLEAEQVRNRSLRTDPA